ncbi:MAG: hypothetical protein V5804_10775 [Mucilaginibacter sp.]|uniref:hypothetical protein n=1 Tax=Mucilaginibacter sp. TaxID=1882438 RepID=UPI0034E470B3
MQKLVALSFRPTGEILFEAVDKHMLLLPCKIGGVVISTNGRNLLSTLLQSLQRKSLPAVGMTAKTTAQKKPPFSGSFFYRIKISVKI